MRSLTKHRYLKSGESSMAVMEVELPTSYEVDVERVAALTRKHDTLQRTEVVDGSTKVVLYFDKVCHWLRERKEAIPVR